MWEIADSYGTRARYPRIAKNPSQTATITGVCLYLHTVVTMNTPGTLWIKDSHLSRDGTSCFVPSLEIKWLQSRGEISLGYQTPFFYLHWAHISSCTPLKYSHVWFCMRMRRLGFKFRTLHIAGRLIGIWPGIWVRRDIKCYIYPDIYSGCDFRDSRGGLQYQSSISWSLSPRIRHPCEELHRLIHWLAQEKARTPHMQSYQIPAPTPR